ncbi:MAG: hypothetical protein AABZ32_10705 [Bacteroidota bacterium]
MGLFSISTEQIKLEEERAKKAIPSRVFFNHFFAINYHIESALDRYDLKKAPYYCGLKLQNRNFDIGVVRKLLWNSWSTEYAFSIGAELNNEDYYKFSLHWNFPQAYYSAYLAMTAFHETQGIANDQHEKSIKLFGNSIKDKHYPEAVSFYAKDLHDNFSYSGLKEFKGFRDNHNGLSKIESLDEAHTQIALFLKSTRIKNAEHKRERLKAANDRSFHNKEGKFRQTFKKEHWDRIYTSLPETTILNIMYRLRIKANYHDIETFVNADIDFKKFHECLGNIIDYLNFVHEAYVVKVIGDVEYKKILDGFPSHLNKDTAIKRYTEHIA